MQWLNKIKYICTIKVWPDFYIRHMIEKKWEFGKDIVMTFIDIEKAYGSVNRQLVFGSIKEKSSQ